MKRLMFFIAIFGLLACEQGETIVVNFDYNEFLQNKEKWERFDIPNYSYTYATMGFMCIANKCTVNDKKVVSVKPDTLSYSYGINDTTIFYTIDEIFQQINYRYQNPIIVKESNDAYWYCYEIEIEYDSVYFFPTRYEFKQRGKNMEITDMGSIHMLTNFKRLRDS